MGIMTYQLVYMYSRLEPSNAYFELHRTIHLATESW